MWTMDAMSDTQRAADKMKKKKKKKRFNQAATQMSRKMSTSQRQTRAQLEVRGQSHHSLAPAAM